jgi:hypothetical protein
MNTIHNGIAYTHDNQAPCMIPNSQTPTMHCATQKYTWTKDTGILEVMNERQDMTL